VLKLAVIGTFFERYDQSRDCIRRVLESTKQPDEFWIMCETEEDAANARQVIKDGIVVLRTPTTDGEYSVIPYSNKINWALDHSKADLFVYLDNGSMPHKDKYNIMYKTLVDNPDWQAVYCSQHRTGFQDLVHLAEEPIPDPYAKVNYTQVMHRKTNKRWTLDMQHATPNDLADALFWRSLETTFYPVPTTDILDVHNMESEKASGL
jgi:hypothetical protein